MAPLHAEDYASALQRVTALEAASERHDPGAFAQAVVRALDGFVAGRLVTLPTCGLYRRVLGAADAARLAGLRQRAMVPIYRDRHIMVSVALDRSGPDFGERSRERLELLRPHLAFLYRQLYSRPSWTPAPRQSPPPGLTARESDVLRWLACGKTDFDIAALLTISPRTVQKHLEHVYVKLGVETRTAAVMRALAMGRGISSDSGLQRPSSGREALSKL